MALPWLSILDAAIGVANLARSRRAAVAAPETALERSVDGGARAIGALGGIEARLAGVVVAALKEAFDRDTRRLELERQQLDAERERAERALKLELMRQAADREVGGLRLIAGMAVVAWIGTLFFSVRLIGAGMGPRILLGIGWALLLGAIGASFTAQSQIADALEREQSPNSSAGQASIWLVIGSMAVIAIAVLIT